MGSDDSYCAGCGAGVPPVAAGPSGRQVLVTPGPAGGAPPQPHTASRRKRLPRQVKRQVPVRPPQPDAGQVIGVVTGAVSSDPRTVSCKVAWLLLRVVAVVSVVGLLTAVIDSGLSLLAWCFTGALGVAIALECVVRFVVGGAGDQRCEVRRFRLTGADGQTVDCVATGNLAGVDLHSGDHVEVRGRRDRRGILGVRRILVTVTSVGATPRPGMIFRAARTTNAIVAVLVVVVATLVGFLVFGLG